MKTSYFHCNFACSCISDTDSRVIWEQTFIRHSPLLGCSSTPMSPVGLLTILHKDWIEFRWGSVIQPQTVMSHHLVWQWAQRMFCVAFFRLASYMPVRSTQTALCFRAGPVCPVWTNVLQLNIQTDPVQLTPHPWRHTLRCTHIVFTVISWVCHLGKLDSCKMWNFISCFIEW